jgi:coenzyme F420 hydrogenase subunit beta
MKPRILDVVENDLCIACGACIEACPKNIVIPTFNAWRGAEEVSLAVDRSECDGCPSPCEDVCPSIKVDFSRLKEFPKIENGQRFGPIKKSVIAYAVEHRDNGVSSSGGIVRALIHDSIERGQAVICLSENDSGGYLPQRIEESDDIQSIPGSIYHSVSFAGAIELCRSSDRDCVLVATPCQLEGIEKYIEVKEPILREKIVLRIGLICGWMFSNHTLSTFAKYKGIKAPVTHAKYRGENEKGRLKFEAGNEHFSFSRRNFDTRKDIVDYQASFSSVLNRLRCRVCENHLNVLADIAVGDAWLKRKEGDKTSIILARSSMGLKRLNELEAKGNLVIEESNGTEDLLESQSAALVYGTKARDISAYLRGRGLLMPKFIYGDSYDSKQSKLTIKKKILISIEMMLRIIVRNRWYRLYRFIYRVRKKVIEWVR